MVERVCQNCRAGNAIEAHYCSKCGTALERQLPARRESSPLAVVGRQLPVSWKQLGRGAALGVAAMAVELGVEVLRRKLEQGAKAHASSASSSTAIKPDSSTTQQIVTILSQRVIEIFDQDDGKRVINDRHVWRKTSGNNE